jgi:DNA-binding NarL/FixJ family response regulator
MVSLLIVDDHPVYRDALHQYLSRRFHTHRVEVCGASSINEGVKLTQTPQTSWVILLDLSVPGSTDHLSGVFQFKALKNVCCIAAISGLDENVWKHQCLSAGCDIFISKNNDADDIYQALCAVMKPYLPEAVESRLTQRQLEILKFIAEGQANKIIAHRLEIKEQTVKIHINAIFKELSVTNRTQAAYKAKELNLI